MNIDIQNLLTRMLDSGMTQKAIADEVECSQSTISDMARGELGLVRPSYKIVSGLKRLAKKKGIPLAQQVTMKSG